MTPELQARTRTGLTVLMVGFAFQLVLPAFGALLATTFSNGALDAHDLSVKYSLSFLLGAFVSLVIDVVALVLLLRTMGAYAQFAIAAALGAFGLEAVQAAVQCSGRSFRESSVFVSGAGIASSLLWVGAGVAVLLLLRRATKLAGARPSVVATVLVSVLLAWTLLRGFLFTAVGVLFGLTLLIALQVVNQATHAVLELSFLWLAFRARRAIGGLVLAPSVSASEAYRGPKEFR